MRSPVTVTNLCKTESCKTVTGRRCLEAERAGLWGSEEPGRLMKADDAVDCLSKWFPAKSYFGQE